MTCTCCGEPGEPIEVERHGEIIAAGALCDSCFAQAEAALEELRAQFDSLIAAGVPRETANRIMIDRIDGKAATA